ncbi:hypothetical protein Avbf_08951 [Armadillidium vulgare]|nr:hypothetical protein Avbf_08951 [Armadillidium vulgare]
MEAKYKISTKASREVKKGKLVAIKCDLTKDEEVIAVFDQIKKEYNGVDVCINNAGFTDNKPLLSGPNLGVERNVRR